ncbi:unnamed protein product [Diatraea saccharalis]|uniref:ATPase AAA-type core domain-containing protein n=1 Tax=Diatraea saccharalis TaxID=40085 RepID=A0A9N9WIV6_9NEOP|nr:unnamed protein product [Diatraea saccharalis]
MKALIEKDKQKKEAQQLLKLRCDPFSDPGYEVKRSELKQELIEAIQKYRTVWSVHDRFAPDRSPEVIYGFMKTFLTEELMKEMHVECRKHVDDLMRLDLKLLISMQQLMYKRVGWKYPKMTPRKKPKVPQIPKPLLMDSTMFKEFEPLFDMGIVTKPTVKLKEVYGDLNYAAYDMNIRDPDVSFPLPGYGDVKRRITYSCIYGIGLNPGATRLKAVLLLGPPRNGKSFLVDAAAGELNAVKFDITPEMFSAQIADKPAKLLGKVFVAARAFQPSVIFLRNIEKVFAKKILPEDKYLNANQMKVPLAKLVKSISNEDKDYQQFIEFFLDSNPTLKKEREEYDVINKYREVMYQKMAAKKKKKKVE